jgi:hypothetical protein
LSWIDIVKPSAGIAALTIACMAGPAMADTLVVRSAGPSAKSYPPGRAIADADRIVLQANDQVVVLDGRGTRTLRGPGTFSPVAASGSAADTRSTLSSLVAQRSDRRARIGAVRSVSAAPSRSPNIWFVDIDRSTTVCVADPAAVTMWRSGVPKPAKVTVTSSPAGKSETLAWDKDAPTAPWPASMPISNGAQYSISVPGVVQPTNVRFAVLGTGLHGLEDLASVLIKNGCTAQLDLLIETVAIPEPATAKGG